MTAKIYCNMSEIGVKEKYITVTKNNDLVNKTFQM